MSFGKRYVRVTTLVGLKPGLKPATRSTVVFSIFNKPPSKTVPESIVGTEPSVV